MSPSDCRQEEDFVSNLYNRTLLTEIPEQDVSQLLDDELTRLEAGEVGSDALRAALTQRLQFRKSFLHALSVDLGILEGGSNPHWDDSSDLVQSIQQSHHVGKLVAQAFSAKIQRKLASTVPPRPIVDLGFDDALVHLKRLCQDGKDVVHVRDYQGSNEMMVSETLNGTSCMLTWPQTFVWTFQSRKPQPSIYIRALLQSLLFHEGKILGQVSLKKLIFDDLAEIVLPADALLDAENWDVEAPQDPRWDMARKMDKLVGRASQVG